MFWTKVGHILDFHVQCMSKSFMIGQGFDRHWTGLDSHWTDLVNFPAFGQTLDGGWTGFGFCVQALSNQPSLRSTVFSPNISKFAIDTLYHHCTASTQLQSISNISASPCMAFLSSFQTSTPSHSTEWIKPPKSPKTLKPSKFCSLMVFNHSAASDSISSELTHQSPDQAQCQMT